MARPLEQLSGASRRNESTDGARHHGTTPADAPPIIESVYVRRAERIDGDFANKEIVEFPRAKDTGHPQ